MKKIIENQKLRLRIETQKFYVKFPFAAVLGPATGLGHPESRSQHVHPGRQVPVGTRGPLDIDGQRSAEITEQVPITPGSVHAVSLIRNPLIRNSPEDSWKNRKWNPEPFEPKVQNKK